MKKRFIYEKSLPFEETASRIGFPLAKRIYSGRSKHQKIDVYDLHFWGRALYLDGILQTCERDEFIYHEMIVHPAMFCHPNPENILIIGGGDGGSLREVIRHKSVKKVLLSELDGKVVEVCRKYMPKISQGAFEDERAEVVIGDGREVIAGHSNYFDAVILDLPDPSDNCKDLISTPFYRKVKKAMSANGIVSIQSGSFTAQPRLVSLINKRLKNVFKFVRPNRMCIPSYQAGEFSLTMASDFDFSKVNAKNLEKKSKGFDFRYWSPEMHFCSALLPKYISEKM